MAAVICRVEADTIVGDDQHQASRLAPELYVYCGGSAVPGDCLILESQDLYVNEATLTGETRPARSMIRRSVV